MTKPVYFPSVTKTHPGIVVPNEKLYFAFTPRAIVIVPAESQTAAQEKLADVDPIMNVTRYNIQRFNQKSFNQIWRGDFSVLAKEATANGVKEGLKLVHRDDPNASSYIHALWVILSVAHNKRHIDIPFVVRNNSTTCQAPIGGVEVLRYNRFPYTGRVMGLKTRLSDIRQG